MVRVNVRGKRVRKSLDRWKIKGYNQPMEPLDLLDVDWGAMVDFVYQPEGNQLALTLMLVKKKTLN